MLSEPGSPVVALPYPESAARALGLAAERCDWLERAPGPRPSPTRTSRGPHDRRRGARRSPGRWLPPHQLARCSRHTASRSSPSGRGHRGRGRGRCPRARLPGRRQDRRAGGPQDRDRRRRARSRDEAQVRDAVERIGAPVIVQPFLTSGTELLAGVVQDPVFGPLIAFGPGGALAELIGDAGFRLAPLTGARARELVTDGKAGTRCRFPGAAPADAGALVDLLLASDASRRTFRRSPSSTSIRSSPARTVASRWTLACASPPPTRRRASRAGEKRMPGVRGDRVRRFTCSNR